MKVNDYGIVGYTQQELVEHLRINPSFDITNLSVVDGEQYIAANQAEYIDLPQIQLWNDIQDSEGVAEYHRMLQSEWLMPEEYKMFDIVGWLVAQCDTPTKLERVNTELKLYQEFNLINLLRYLKYIRDIAKHNDIVWGVGRGSSCCSYCLCLMEIHRIDALAYELDIHEFLRTS